MRCPYLASLRKAEFDDRWMRNILDLSHVYTKMWIPRPVQLSRAWISYFTNHKWEKITIKNRQLPLATQAKYTLIDLSVQVRSTVVQNI